MRKRRPSGQTIQVLGVLLARPDEAQYGLEISKAARLLPGSIYTITARLMELGWLDDEWEDQSDARDGRPARRYYKLTPKGRDAAAQAVAEFQAAFAGKGALT
ncbi:PadR family transcriptional regulator [uncultured Deinococcus sp.]|uniref:PadR family transcriptional regulator n=1 Tax=uncultured Deinococcus sp. TaxID=158789 RepID=UPI0025DFCC8E|nr:PadR family transcriptional regulator [uncultured Deinococcus sp.]